MSMTCACGTRPRITPRQIAADGSRRPKSVSSEMTAEPTSGWYRSRNPEAAPGGGRRRFGWSGLRDGRGENVAAAGIFDLEIDYLARAVPSVSPKHPDRLSSRRK